MSKLDITCFGIIREKGGDIRPHRERMQKEDLEKKFKDWLRDGEDVGAGSKKNQADTRSAADKSAPEGNLK